jgi:hypothetical protein
MTLFFTRFRNIDPNLVIYARMMAALVLGPKAQVTGYHVLYR